MGRTVLVTGSTSGIGLETARRLAAMGARVVLGVRDAGRGEAVASEIARAGGNAEVLPIDLGSFASVRRAAERFSASQAALDVLVNNAAIAVARRELSVDGHELTWETNFLSAFLLTRLLLPALKRAARPRVVNVGSDAHRVGRIDWGNLELSKGFGGYPAYANSKLALLLFTKELARREPRVCSNVLHPGAIATNIWRAVPGPFRWAIRAVLPSPGRGAAPVVRLASDPGLDGVTGRYFSRFREATPSWAGLHEADAARLWDVAASATGVAP